MYKLDEISVALARLDDPALVERFLRSILTPDEVCAVSSRWALVRLLDSGASQREVAKRLGLSLCKITRGARELKKRQSAFKQMIDRYHALTQKTTA